MSGYTKTAWVDGGVPALSAANLNKMETEGEHALGVDSLAALRALPVPTFAQRCWARGHTTVNDGGSGPFDWDASCVDLDDDGITILPSGHSGAGRWVRNFENVVSVMWYGAVGDGVTDDYDAIIAANDYCVATGADMLIPSGYTFAVDTSTGHQILYGCNVFGYGATIKFTAVGGSTLCVSNYDGTTSYTGKGIYGLTVDSNDLGIGIYLTEADDYIIRDCKISNCLVQGIRVIESDDVIIDSNSVTSVAYVAAGTGGADGIYINGCRDAKVINNHIQDFRRIGIVSEGATTVSSGTLADGNTVHNANNCDDSATEFNAGIWFENTNGGWMTNNRIYDILDNAGQTSGRVRGLVIGVGTTLKSLFVVSGNDIEGAVTAAPGFNYSTVIFENNYIRKDGMSIRAAQKYVIRGNHFDNMTDTSLITHDSGASATNAIGTLLIDGVTQTNITTTNYNFADLSLFDPSGGIEELIITNVADFSIVNRGSNDDIGKFIVSNSSILHGSTTGYGLFKARNILVANCHISNRSTSDQSGFISDSDSVMTTKFDNCHFDSIDTNLTLLSSGSTCNFDSSYFASCAFDAEIVDSTTLSFNGCAVNGYDATNGFLRTNSATATTERLMVRGCDFQNLTDVTPLQTWSHDPSIIILQGNSHNSTALDNFTSPDSDVNNVAV